MTRLERTLTSRLTADLTGALLFVAGSGFVAGCGANGGDGGGGGTEAGVTIALTDAATEEIASFTVDVTGFQLKAKSGAVVGVLQSAVTVDLLSLTDLSQVLNVVSVPPALYDGGTITFDFSNAVAVLEGNPTPATILDSNGFPLTGALALPLQFGNKPLNAVAGKHKLLELDFDLDQSLIVDAGANTVSVEPVMVMRVDPTSPKELVLIGDLTSVDLAASTFEAEIKRLFGPTIGKVELAAKRTTVYQIDGVPSIGSAGLAALDALGVGTWVQVYGSIDPLRPRLTALYVEAGTGTYNGGSDIVEGHVLARSSGAGTSATLTVYGHSNNATHTVFQFNTTFTVLTSIANTRVVKSGVVQVCSLDDANVGQRVRVFGALTGTTMDASMSGDVLRLRPTYTYGYANGAPAGGTLAMDLSRVGPVPEGVFSWADAGANPPNPNAFTVDESGLAAGLGIVTGTAVSARGFFAAVDDPNEDLDEALSIVNLDLAPSVLFIRDEPFFGHTMTVSANPTELQFAISGTAGLFEAALIDRGFVGAVALPTSPVPQLVPPASGLTLYLIKDKVLGSTTLYLKFDPFSAGLAQAIAGGAHVKQVAAIGTYDVATNSIESPLASVCIE
jgi:hypothetical protein